MTTQDMLKIMRLLSALESWSFSAGKSLPDYLFDDLTAVIAKLEAEILKGQK